MIVPFVYLYTNHVSDADYIQPTFAALLILAHAIHCLRIPYNMLILATGAYKEAQNMHIITAIINIVISIAVVHSFGLIGVAVGTLAAMVYQTSWMVLFDSKNNICWPIKKVIKQLLFDLLCIAIIGAITHYIPSMVKNYIDWVILAIKEASISFVVVVAMSFMFYRLQMKGLIRIIKR